MIMLVMVAIMVVMIWRAMTQRAEAPVWRKNWLKAEGKKESEEEREGRKRGGGRELSASACTEEAHLTCAHAFSAHYWHVHECTWAQRAHTCTTHTCTQYKHMQMSPTPD